MVKKQTDEEIQKKVLTRDGKKVTRLRSFLRQSTFSGYFLRDGSTVDIINAHHHEEDLGIRFQNSGNGTVDAGMPHHKNDWGMTAKVLDAVTIMQYTYGNTIMEEIGQVKRTWSKSL